MDQLKMHSPNLMQANVARIREFFPNCVTEAKDADGAVKLTVDFDQLRQELSDSIVEGPQERYHLNWPGKREALLTANAPIAKTLRPCREESVDFDTTQNLFIEGDNLDALKLLQETYLGKVKMIYIDPPYNTGKEFIYDDDFREDATKYFERSNQKDEVGHHMVANTESNGRFHSDWLTMMYSRLRLAKNLLNLNGVIFLSIHDAELANLKKICDEIFGGENFVGQVTWKARVKPVNIGEAKYRPQKEVEYVLIYQKQLTPATFFPLYTGGMRTYPHQLGERKYRLTTILKSNRGTNQRSTMTFSLGDYSPPDAQRWQAGEDVINQLNEDGYIEFRDGTPFRRYFEDEEGAEHDPFYCFMEVDWSSTSEAGKNQLNQILGDRHGFDTVKPVRLIKTLIQSCTSGREEIILDFFSGSATTAHAVMALNAEDGGKRRHIMVQIPEASEENSESYKAGYETIAEIGKERIRRAGKKIKEENALTAPDLDIGFRVLKVDTSNLAEVYYTPDAVSQDLLSDQVDNIKPDRTAEDLLFQVMLDWGVDLSLPIVREKWKMDNGQWVRLSADNSQFSTINSQLFEVFFVDTNALAACFDNTGNIDEAFVKELAKTQPLRVVFRDAGFRDSAVKINIEQIFKLLSPGTEVKCI